MIGNLHAQPDASDAMRSSAAESWLDRPLLVALNWERAAYLLIFVLAVVSRFYDLGARVMSHDESLHTMYSYYFVDGRGFSHTPLMHGPFLFHITALSYFLFGASDFTARLPFALFGIALVMLPLVFRRELGRAGALAASTLLLISPSILYHARYIRQEGTILVWTMLTLLCVWRYLNTRKTSWLTGLGVVLAFHGADKSTSFMSVAMFAAFLAPIALYQLWRMRNDRQDALRAVVFALVLGAAMLVATLIAELAATGLESMLNVQSLIAPGTQDLATNLSSFGYIAILAVLIGGMGFGLYQLLKRSFGDWMTRAHDHSPAWNLLVVMVSTTLLMASPALLIVLNPLWKGIRGEELVNIDLLGNDSAIKSNPDVVTTMLGLTLSVAMIAIVLAVLWNWRRAIVALGTFMAITLPLFTSIFTNAAGIGTGYVGQLGYWMAQHDVKRGDQPWYYYFVVVPLYEYLPIIGMLIAITLLSCRIVLGKGDWIGKVKAHLFPLLLLWLATASWLLFSYAGEKMPWLTVHIALPMVLLSAWTVQQMIAHIRPATREQQERIEVLDAPEAANSSPARAVMTAVGLALLAVLFTIRFLSVLGGFDSSGGRAVIIPAVINGAFALALAAACLALMKRYLAQGARAMYGLAALFVLALLTVRTAVTVTYINHDYTKEFLFYAHGAPGPKRVLNDINRMIERFGGSRQLSIGHVQSLAWPMTWYLRDVPNARFLGENLPDDYSNLDIILVSPNKDAKFQDWADSLAAEYDRFDQNFIWWPMEDYKGMTWQRLSYAFGNPQARAAMWEIIFNRNYEPYSRLFNKTLTPENWPLRDQIAMFVRKDVSAQMWDYRNGAAMSSGAPVAPPTIKLRQPTNLAFAPDGTRWVIDHRANRLFHMDAAGGVIKTIGGTGNQPSRFNDPWGVAVDATGNVYVADTFNHRIQKFDAEGNFQFAWGVGGSTTEPGNGRDTQFFGPRDIVIDGQGRLLVTDTGNKRVQVFDSEGNFVTQFGGPGAGDGQFNEPTGLAIDGDGTIYVSDTWNKRVQVFSPDYAFVRAFPVPQWDGMDPGLFNSTEHKPFVALHKGRVFLSSPRSGQVLVFKTSGEPQELTQLGFAPEDMPTGVEVRGDMLYVTNAKTGAVQEFDLGAGAQ